MSSYINEFPNNVAPYNYLICAALRHIKLNRNCLSMAMLAERKQKQKWTLNPRGKYWSEDTNKFGQKMLEKMGWTSGKGLGANEDGITEHIKQSYKNDSKGIGFEDKGNQWTKHEVDFSSLLQNLGDNNTESNLKKPEVSLEKKSQSSRSRVHYHKFTRGKDLSRYSEKDLANVFGRKTLEKRHETAVQETVDEVSTENKEFGVTTVNAGNMADYFKNKLQTVISKTVSSESDEERPVFGFGYTPSPVTEIELKKDGVEKKKKKNKTKVVINDCFDNAGFTDFPDQPEQTLDNQNMAFDNYGLDLKSPEQEIVTQTIDTQKRKKLKKRKLEIIPEENNTEPQAVEEPQIVESAPKKKKKKCTEDIAQENTENVSGKWKKKHVEEMTNVQVNTELTTTTKKKSNEQISTQDVEKEEPSKKKKRKKSDNISANGVDNPACTANSVQQNIEETIASMSSAIDNYQLELENQMNEIKARKRTDKWIPKFKDNRNKPRTSVKHIIKEKGVVKYNFEGSNLPKIPGYGIKR